MTRVSMYIMVFLITLFFIIWNKLLVVQIASLLQQRYIDECFQPILCPQNSLRWRASMPKPGVVMLQVEACRDLTESLCKICITDRSLDRGGIATRRSAQPLAILLSLVDVSHRICYDVNYETETSIQVQDVPHE
jgi:hypothetical protein